MKKVLVTGANSLLASNVIIELLGRGYLIRGLLRNLNGCKCPAHNHFELFQGDITDNIAVEKAISSCDYVIHAAAITDQNLLHYDDYYQVNVAATENLIRLAILNRVKRFVYIGTANVIGFGSIEEPGNESFEIKRPFTDSHYAKSKLEAQKLVLSYKDSIDVLVINPAFKLGPYDSKPGSGRIILMGHRKKLIFYPPGGKNFVHVQDVANAVAVAMEMAANGEVFLIANENLTYQQFFQKMAFLTQSKPFLVKIPKIILLTLGLVGNMLRAAGIKTDLSLTNMKILCVRNFYDNTKARTLLGLKFQTADKAIEDALSWFAENKMIR